MWTCILDHCRMHFTWMLSRQKVHERDDERKQRSRHGAKLDQFVLQLARQDSSLWGVQFAPQFCKLDMSFFITREGGHSCEKCQNTVLVCLFSFSCHCESTWLVLSCGVAATFFFQCFLIDVGESGGWFRVIARLPVTESINQRHIGTFSFCRSSPQNRYSQVVISENNRSVQKENGQFCTKNITL